MTLDLGAASTFIATHARVLDRRRFDLLLGRGSAYDAVAALAAYRNVDGGYGWGLEPDLRAPDSQPVAALHAFEVFEETGTGATHARQLCDWLESVTLTDGGLPFALPMADRAGTASCWAQADPMHSSLHMTSMLAAAAHRVARHDAGVRAHPWLRLATAYSLDEIGQLDEIPHRARVHVRAALPRRGARRRTHGCRGASTAGQDAAHDSDDGRRGRRP